MRIDSLDHREWLERTSLIDTAKYHTLKFQRILKNCLKVNNEEIVVIGDHGYPNRRLATLMSYGYYIAAKKLGLNGKITLQEPKEKNQKAGNSIIKTLEESKTKSILILNLSRKLGNISELGKPYRKFIRENGHRFVSATNLGQLDTMLYPSLLDSIDVDYSRMSKKGHKLKNILDDSDEIQITSKKGTNLYINIKGKKALVNDGLFDSYGKGGNLPAGEVYIAPRGKSKINGKVVIDGSCTFKGGTLLIKEPVTLEIYNGQVVDMYGGREARKLAETIIQANNKTQLIPGSDRIGEIGIGINQNAKVIGATIVDEKTLGTAHIGIGSNYWFGGTIYVNTHFDQVFKNPNIYADGKLLNVSAL